MKATWTAPADAVADARRALAEAKEQSAKPAPVLVAWGRLARLDADDAEAKPDVVVADGLAALDFEALDQAAEAVALHAPDLSLLEDEALTSLHAKLVAALEARDGIECALLGAERLEGSEPALNDEQHELLAAFDALVEPELWRLIPMAELRAGRAAAIAPTHRARFWWWCRGMDVSGDGLDHLSEAAHVIARFPETRDELERLVRGQTMLDGLGADATEAADTGGGADVVSLADWVRARSKPVEELPELDEVVACRRGLRARSCWRARIDTASAGSRLASSW